MTDSFSKNDSSLPAMSVEDNFVLIEMGEKIYKFSKGKNQHIQKARQLNFESIIPRLAAADILAIDDYPEGRDAQGARLYVINIDGYLHEVPFVAEAPNTIFLKNIYPSRKMMLKCWGVQRKSKRLKKRLRKNAASNIAISVDATSITLSINKES